MLQKNTDYIKKCDAIWKNIHKVGKVNFKISYNIPSEGKDKHLEKKVSQKLISTVIYRNLKFESWKSSF